MDWDSPVAVDSAIAEARAGGPIIGLIHLLPLRSTVDTGANTNSWAQRVAPRPGLSSCSPRGLPTISSRRPSSEVPAWLQRPAWAGHSPRGPHRRATSFRARGAIAGLIKTLAREWQGVRCRVVDLDLAASTPHLAERLASEALTDDDWSEVGYANGRRIRLKTVSSPLGGGRKQLDIRPGEPILITGGARGITSLVAAELARRWQPALLLIGATRPPTETDDHELGSLKVPSEIKTLLYDRMKRSGRLASPGELEHEYQSVIRGREIGRNIAVRL